ncbi:Dynein regulatory complex protein 10 [Camponotus japonicus]
MHLMPEHARHKELYYRQFWRCHKKSANDIAIFTTDLERQRINHKRMLENIVKRYRKNLIAINEIDKKCNEDITNTTIKYEKKQFTLYKTWEFEQNEIRLGLENVIDDFESLKDINTKLEQTIRKRRLTIESKLLAIIAKYDIEIGSRYRILEELNEAYKYDKLEKHTLEKKMKRQEVYFNRTKRKNENNTFP